MELPWRKCTCAEMCRELSPTYGRGRLEFTIHRNKTGFTQAKELHLVVPKDLWRGEISSSGFLVIVKQYGTFTDSSENLGI
jgi:hypothetical protein